ncbi:MAG: hypothetical protein JW801_01100 [Bacteroidales bacterium]|nr:hypothetical protein [Bacteroidales bacterium]
MKFAKYLYFSILFLFLALQLHAQYNNPDESAQTEQKARKDQKGLNPKFFMSPRLGFSAWGDYAYFEIAPIAGYKFTHRFWLGAGPEYMFLKHGDNKTSIYGGTAFAYFAILDHIDEVVNLGIGSLFLYLENEILSIKPDELSRGWYDILLGGVGVRMPINDRMGISVIALWGLNDASNLLYSSPEIRIMYDF